jgi:hypothetical protein
MVQLIKIYLINYIALNSIKGDDLNQKTTEFYPLFNLLHIPFLLLFIRFNAPLSPH